MMFVINEVSSFSLRKGRKGEFCKIDDPFKFTCGGCKKSISFGSKDGAYGKVHYTIAGTNKEIVLCSRCCDLLIDAMVWGSGILSKLDTWSIPSRVASMSLVQKDQYCMSCAGKESTHLLIKYDALAMPGNLQQKQFKRMCARCAVTYLELLASQKGLKSCKHTYLDPDSINPVNWRFVK